MIRKTLIVLGLMMISTSALAHIEPGIQGHNYGDIIAVRTDAEIAAWCDFTKQIVLAQPNTLCVYKKI